LGNYKQKADFTEKKTASVFVLNPLSLRLTDYQAVIGGWYLRD
jgi:hypothetical protein